MEHACFSTSSGVEIHLKLAVSKVAAKATVLGGVGVERGGRGGGRGGALRISEGRLEPGSGGGEWACLVEPIA